MEKASLKLNTSTGDYLIDTNTIVRIEASSNYSKIYFSNGKTLLTAKLLKWFEEKLQPASFTRLHRSHLINNGYVQLYKPACKTLELQNGKIIPVSRRKKKFVLQKFAAACLLLIFLSQTMFSQSVGVGTNAPHASAALDVVSTNKGLSIPSMTTAQRNAIVSPKAGLFVFDTQKQTLCMFNGTHWVYFQSSVESNVVPPTEVEALDGSVGDEFGNSIAMDGNYAVIGAHLDNIASAPDQGSAYIFFFNGTNWVQQAKLTAADGAASDNFGCCVSISGDYIVVGADGDDVGSNSNQGSAYIFLRSGTTWTQQAKITAANGAAGDNFGCSVSISGSYIAVGAKGDDIGANTNEGSAYFFVRSGVSWTQQDYVVAPTGAADDAFGTSVSISGDYAIVGAPLDDHDGLTNNGSVNVFFRVGVNWTHQQTVYKAPITADYQAFGKSLSLNGNLFTAGWGSNSATASGVKIFTRNGTLWDNANGVANFEPIINESAGAGFGFWGLSFAGTHFIVGTPGSSSPLFGQGAAYLYEVDLTTGFPYFLRKITDPLGAVQDYAGTSAATTDLYTMIGAPSANGFKGKVLILSIQ